MSNEERRAEAASGWAEWRGQRSDAPVKGASPFSETPEQESWRLEGLRRKNPAEWLRVVRPKVTAVGLKMGLTHDQIETKLQMYARHGFSSPR